LAAKRRKGLGSPGYFCVFVPFCDYGFGYCSSPGQLAVTAVYDRRGSREKQRSQTAATIFKPIHHRQNSGAIPHQRHGVVVNAADRNERREREGAEHSVGGRLQACNEAQSIELKVRGRCRVRAFKRPGVLIDQTPEGVSK